MNTPYLEADLSRCDGGPALCSSGGGLRALRQLVARLAAVEADVLLLPGQRLLRSTSLPLQRLFDLLLKKTNFYES